MPLHNLRLVRPYISALTACSIAAMGVSNPGHLPVRIHSCDTAPTPTGFAEIVSNDLPVLYTDGKAKFSNHPDLI
jgi:hypothetical protein